MLKRFGYMWALLTAVLGLAYTVRADLDWGGGGSQFLDRDGTPLTGDSLAVLLAVRSGAPIDPNHLVVDVASEVATPGIVLVQADSISTVLAVSSAFNDGYLLNSGVPDLLRTTQVAYEVGENKTVYLVVWDRDPVVGRDIAENVHYTVVSLYADGNVSSPAAAYGDSFPLPPTAIFPDIEEEEIQCATLFERRAVPVAEADSTPAAFLGEDSLTLAVTAEGISRYRYKLDDDSWSAETSETSVLADLAEGQHTLLLIGRDEVGNWQEMDQATEYTWVVDTIAPAVTGLADDDAPTKGKTWTWSATDADSELVYRYAIDQDEAGGPTGDYAQGTTASKTDGDGRWYLHVQALDRAGNEGSVTTVSTLLDNMPPVITGLSDDDVPRQSKTWSWDAVDVDNDIVFRYAIDQDSDGEPDGAYQHVKDTHKADADETWYLHVQATDRAGNESAVLTVHAVLDNTAPSLPADSDPTVNLVAEGAVGGTTVGVTAFSTDAPGSEIAYTLADNGGGRFGIASDSGVITVADGSLLNFENVAVHNVMVTATDTAENTSSASFTVEVRNVAPLAVGENASTGENGTASGNVLDNDSDTNGGTLTVSAVNGQEGNVGTAVPGTTGGAFTINDDGSWTFSPGNDFDDLAGQESRQTAAGYSCSDGNDNESATLTVTVEGVNDAPVLDLDAETAGIGSTAAFAEDGGAVPIVDADGLSVGDVDDTDVESAQVGITNLLDGEAEKLSADPGETAIAVAYESGTTGVLSLTGTASVAEYQAVLRTVTYNNTSQDPSTTARVIEVTVNDGKAASAAATCVVTIIAENDAPVISGQEALSTPEETELTITPADLHVTDPDNTYPGEFSLTVQDGANYSREANTITPVAEFNGTLTAPVVVNDGASKSNVYDLTVSVPAVNDAPILAAVAPEMPTISEDDTDNEGMLLSEIIADSVSDVDVGAAEGVAIYAGDPGNGAWQYCLADAVGLWKALGNVAEGHALLLRAEDRLRILPNGENGTTATVDFYAWDQTAEEAGEKLDVSSRGGTTAFSAAGDRATVAVSSTNDPPSVAAPIPDQGTIEDAQFTFTFADNTFIDIDADDTLSYSAGLVEKRAPLPDWLDFEPATRTFIGTPRNADVGTISVQVTATDSSSASVDDLFEIAVANTNDAPTFTSVPLMSATEDTLYTYSIICSDVDTDDPGSDLTMTVLGKPDWLTFFDYGDGTARLEGIPTDMHVGDNAVKVRVADDSHASTEQDFAVVVDAQLELTLAPGWNLLSLPFGTADRATPAEILVDADGAVLFTGGIWGWSPGAAEYEQLQENLVAEAAFWAFCPAQENVKTKCITGRVSDSSISLLHGWNMVGPSRSCLKLEIHGLDKLVEPIWYWDATTQMYRALQADETLERGKGYWFYVSEETGCLIRAGE